MAATIADDTTTAAFVDMRHLLNPHPSPAPPIRFKISIVYMINWHLQVSQAWRVSETWLARRSSTAARAFILTMSTTAALNRRLVWSCSQTRRNHCRPTRLYQRRRRGKTLMISPSQRALLQAMTPPHSTSSLTRRSVVKRKLSW